VRIRSLLLKDFGPFGRYEIEFLPDEGVCLLLTGRNNEGKSTIINALKLVNAAARVIGWRKQLITLRDDEYYRLLKQDTDGLTLGRLVHNYRDTVAEIRARFSDGFGIAVYLDPMENLVLCQTPNDG
jgi:predicted ATP-binding protein involved in virulence